MIKKFFSFWVCTHCAATAATAATSGLRNARPENSVTPAHMSTGLSPVPVQPHAPVHVHQREESGESGERGESFGCSSTQRQHNESRECRAPSHDWGESGGAVAPFETSTSWEIGAAGAVWLFDRATGPNRVSWPRRVGAPGVGGRGRVGGVEGVEVIAQLRCFLFTCAKMATVYNNYMYITIFSFLPNLYKYMPINIIWYKKMNLMNYYFFTI